MCSMSGRGLDSVPSEWAGLGGVFSEWAWSGGVCLMSGQGPRQCVQ